MPAADGSYLLWVQERHLGRTPQTSQRHRHYSSTKTRNPLHCLPKIIYQLISWISRVFFCLKMKPSEIPFLMALFWCLCLCQVCFKSCAKFLVGLSPFPASHLFRKEYQVTALANKKQRVWDQNHSSHSESQSSPQLISVPMCFKSSKYHCFISLHAHQPSLTFRWTGNKHALREGRMWVQVYLWLFISGGSSAHFSENHTSEISARASQSLQVLWP